MGPSDIISSLALKGEDKYDREYQVYRKHSDTQSWASCYGDEVILCREGEVIFNELVPPRWFSLFSANSFPLEN